MSEQKNTGSTSVEIAGHHKKFRAPRKLATAVMAGGLVIGIGISASRNGEVSAITAPEAVAIAEGASSDLVQMEKRTTEFAQTLQKATEGRIDNPRETDNVSAPETIDDGSVLRSVTFSAESYNDQVYTLSEQQYPDGTAVVGLEILQTSIETSQPEYVYSITIDPHETHSVQVRTGDGRDLFGRYDGSAFTSAGVTPIDSADKMNNVITQAESYLLNAQTGAISSKQPSPIG